MPMLGNVTPGRSVRALGGLLALTVAVALVGCGGGESKEDSAKRLKQLKDEMTLASMPTEVMKVIDDCLEIAAEDPGSKTSDAAYRVAEDGLLAALLWSEPTAYYEGASLPAPRPGWESEIDPKAHRARVMLAFSQQVPDEYRDSALAAARTLLAEVASEWSDRLLDTAQVRDSWTQQMKKGSASGSYGSFTNEDKVNLAYARELAPLVPNPKLLVDAYAAVAAGVEFAIANTPGASSHKATGSNSITSYYSSAEVNRAVADAKKLLGLATAAQQAAKAVGE